MEQEKKYSEEELRKIEDEIRQFKYDENRGYAFISYSHLDRDWVLPVVLNWKQAGYNIYIDLEFERWTSDYNWVDLMKRALSDQNCRLMVCFWSEFYMYSYAAFLELLSARSDNTRFWRNGDFPIDIVTRGSNEFKIPSEIPKKIPYALEESFKSIRPIGATSILAKRVDELKVLHYGLEEWQKEVNPGGNYEREAAKLFEYLNQKEDKRFFFALSKVMGTWFNSLFLDKNVHDILKDSNCKLQYERFDDNGVKRNSPLIHPVLVPPHVKLRKEEEKRPQPQTVTGGDDVKPEGFCVVIGESEEEVASAGLLPTPDDREDFEIKDTVLIKYIGSKSVVTIPDGIAHIGATAFYDCKKLQEIIIPNSVVSIGAGAFWNCEQLENVVLPESICNIGTLSFANCQKLRKINIPPQVMFIGYGTFFNCNCLEKIYIPYSVAHIGAEAFCGCKKLQTIHISPNVYSIGTSAFKWCESLRTLEIPPDVKYIGSSAFAGCMGLETVKFLGGSELDEVSKLLKIEDSLFKNCLSLTDISLPPKVEIIREGAFENCIRLKHINIPNSVRQIGEGTFHESGVAAGRGAIHFEGTRTQWENIKKDSTEYENISIDFAKLDDFEREIDELLNILNHNNRGGI